MPCPAPGPTVIAWTLLDGESRAAFRAALPLDGATWSWGRSWALRKALITAIEWEDRDPRRADREGFRIMDAVMADERTAR